MRSRLTRALMVGSLITVAITVQGGVRAMQQDSWVAPERAARRQNPLQPSPQLLAGGARTFANRCAECHGPMGGGTDRAPNLTSSSIRHQSDGALFWKISSGNARSGMPAFSRLPEGQRWQLVLFVRSLVSADSP